MHHTVLDFVGRALRPEEVAGKRVLEIGSYDVNGSVRPLIEQLAPAEYIGTDMRAGPGVDRVVDAGELVTTFGPASFDLVISLEMLEHAEDWRAAIRNMKAVLAPGCPLLLATVSWGFPLHDYPSDYWRFEPEDMRQIFADMELSMLEPDGLVPGVFVKATKPLGAREPVELDRLTMRSMQTGCRG